MTLSCVRTGLCPELQKELIPRDANSLERAYQVVQELEHYLKLTNVVEQTKPVLMVDL